jgi:hypothetical protein
LMTVCGDLLPMGLGPACEGFAPLAAAVR